MNSSCLKLLRMRQVMMLVVAPQLHAPLHGKWWPGPGVSLSFKLKCSNAHPFHALYASYCTHCEHTTNIHHSPDTKLFFLLLVSLERRQHMLSLFGGYPTTTYCTNGYWVSMIQCIIKYVLMTQIIQLFANMLYPLYKNIKNIFLWAT